MDWEFFKNKPQRVRVNGILSDYIVLHSGLPQGCVLSPLLFSVYTNELKCNIDDLTLIKYADDLVLISCQTDKNCPTYFEYIESLVQWCDNSCLRLNTGKTKELCCGNQNKKCTGVLQYEEVTIKGVKIEQVKNFKYLGTIIDDKLLFLDNVNYVHKKARQRLSLLRKLRNLDIEKRILTIVYRSMIESIITYNIVSWYGNLTMKLKNKLTRVINEANKIIGHKQSTLQELFSNFMEKKALAVFSDQTHPLHSCFEVLPSGRRLRTPYARKNIFKRSFVPLAVTVLNQILN